MRSAAVILFEPIIDGNPCASRAVDPFSIQDLSPESAVEAFIECCQTNRLKHQKPRERALYVNIRERHSVRAASRISLKVLRFESDLCELNRL